MTHPAHRVFQTVNETIPKQLPVLLRAMAEKGDIESLTCALESGAVEGSKERISVVCAIAPLAKSRDNPEVAQLCDAWLAKLGFDSEEKLSRKLTRTSVEHVQDLIALGANPQFWMKYKDDGRQVTPLAEAFSKPPGSDQANLIRDMLAHLHAKGIVPMAVRFTQADGEVKGERNLFGALLSLPGTFLFKDTAFPESVFRYLTSFELDERWKLAAGDAVLKKCATLDRQRSEPHYDKVLANVVDILPVTRFGNPDGWEAVANAIGKEEFGRLLIDRFDSSQRDRRVLQNMLADGFDINRVTGSFTLSTPGSEGPSAKRTAKLRGNWLHLAIDAERFYMFSQLLEAGLDPRPTLGDLNPNVVGELREITARRLIEVTAEPGWSEHPDVWLSAIDAVLAKLRIDEVLANAGLKASATTAAA